MSTLLEVLDLNLLGVTPPKHASPMKLVELVERGLPLKALDRVSTRIAPDDTGFKYKIVPKATLARYGQRLNSMQSSKVARLAGVWTSARNVWGSDQAARDFLFRPHQLLDGRRPIDVAIENELGGELVRNILGRLEFGSAA